MDNLSDETKSQLDQIRTKFNELGLECSYEQSLVFLRSSNLKRECANLLDANYTMAEIVRTIKEITAERSKQQESLN